MRCYFSLIKCESERLIERLIERLVERLVEPTKAFFGSLSWGYSTGFRPFFLAIFLSFFLLPSGFCGDQLGRLFFTPNERDFLDAQKKALDEQQSAASEATDFLDDDLTVRVKGFVLSSQGASSIWVTVRGNGNGVNQTDESGEMSGEIRREISQKISQGIRRAATNEISQEIPLRLSPLPFGRSEPLFQPLFQLMLRSPTGDDIRVQVGDLLNPRTGEKTGLIDEGALLIKRSTEK